MESAEPLLSVRQLSARFAASERGALDEVTFDVPRGSIVALVGDSGSGKSLTALSILGLLPEGVQVSGGQICFEGRDLLQAAPAELTALRGRRIGMIFQEPATALSAVHTVGWQLALALRAGGRLGSAGLLERLSLRQRARRRALAGALLAQVELPEPEKLLDLYPHQLSAGMRRRVMIALALAAQPVLLIADEPTTGVDAPIQAQLLELFSRLAQSEGCSVLFITHDLCVAAEIASEIVVLHAGQVVESGPIRSVLGRPQHPYTLSLLENIPDHLARRWPPRPAQAPAPLPELGGPGCAFAPRCPQRASDPERFVRCTAERPSLEPADARHRSRCFYPRLDGELERPH